ncbi:MAG: D-inositol-3-phosphate glycosyltransferase, partial [Actinomycetia bacterium]|nr:D-inositol-3-phosphate glycosyltransferase [Actinomycetes bacterium]
MHRVALLSVHTSPLDRPGGGDAGGMNVYIMETAKQLAEAGIEVDIFTRATSRDQAPAVVAHPGVTVHHIVTGPFDAVDKRDLPAQLCAFTAGVLRAEARHEPGWYDVIHSHYWLSGQVGWLARDRWHVPLVHAAHTLGKVKNAALADDDVPEPNARLIGEQQVVVEADRLVASTEAEARALIDHYDADAGRIAVVPPGVDLAAFRPGPARRAALGLPPDALVLLFAGRIQPLKAPDLLLRAAARIRAIDPELGRRVRVVVLGAPSGNGLANPHWLPGLAEQLGLAGTVCFRAPVGKELLAEYYRAADLTVIPSFNESFGLVALESQACGTPVVAASVGGLPTAVINGRTGALVDGHATADWADAIAALLRAPGRRAAMGSAARAQAERFSWARTTDGLREAYRDAIEDYTAAARA